MGLTHSRFLYEISICLVRIFLKSKKRKKKTTKHTNTLDNMVKIKR